MREVITFTRASDGTITADRFPDEIAVTPQLLADTDKPMRTLIEINVANGKAVYEVIGSEYAGEVTMNEGVLVEGSFILIARRQS